MIRALCLLLGYDLVGEALRNAGHLPVPGSVIGMLLLAFMLIAQPRDRTPPSARPMLSADLERVSHSLISHMGLLFVPAGVGVIAEGTVLKAEWLAILVGVLGSTLIGLVVTALVMQLPRAEATAHTAPLPGEP
jgi:holin-like protein